MRRPWFVLTLVPILATTALATTALATTALATTAMATPQGAELGKLVGLDSAPGDGFGSAVALSGERALVGAPEHDAFFADDGAAYLFERPNGVWIQVAKLVPSDPLAGSHFGTAVALDGGRAVVTRPAVFGAPGAVYVFELQAGAWVETAKIPGGAVGFGSAVALSGNDLLVGAPKSSSGAFFCGTAYVFELQGGAWVLASQLPPPFCTFPSNQATYGASVALSGDRALVGKKVLIGKGGEPVPAYLFERSGGVWSATAELASGSVSTSQEVTVALHGDVALLGLPLSSDARGSLELYQASGASWPLQDWEAGAMPGDRLGHSVAVAGGRALAGAPGDDTAGADAGAVYAFTLGEQFGNLALLDKTKLPTTLAPGGGLGAAVALHGDLLLAGAPDDGAGAAAVFSAFALDASPAEVSVGSGGSQVLSLGAGAAGAGALFAILGSVSGTAPGQTLGGMAIPLNPDPYFTYTLTHVGQPPLAGGAGLLGPTGGATASFALPAGSPPALVGVVGNHAFVLVDLATLTVTFASNPAEVLLVP